MSVAWVIELAASPLVVLGLLRGAYRSVNALSGKPKEQKQMLEYWVILMAILFIFPVLEYFISFVIWGPILSTLKLGLLVSLVVMDKQSSSVYAIIDEMVMPLVEKQVSRVLVTAEQYVQPTCVVITDASSAMMSSLTISTLAYLPPESVEKLKKRFQKLVKHCSIEQKHRENQQVKSTAPSVLDSMEGSDTTSQTGDVLNRMSDASLAAEGASLKKKD